MPTYRKLHTKIIDSFDFAEMPDDFTRVFWMLLVVATDSEGRMIDNYSWLRSRMFPLRSDISNDQLENTLSWLEDRGMIFRYIVDGRRYFHVVNFKNYQTGTDREQKSTLPAPQERQPDDDITQELLKSGSGLNQELVGPAVLGTVNEYVNESVNAYASAAKTYEKEIGVITATISEEMKSAIEDYPDGWVDEALREAARGNHRSWRYALGILRRWKTDGRTDFGPSRKSKNLPGEDGVISHYDTPEGMRVYLRGTKEIKREPIPTEATA